MSYRPTMASQPDPTQWSEFRFDPRGFYVSSRLNAYGQTEYRYPEPEQPAQSTPRTLCPHSQQLQDGSSDTSIEGGSSYPNYTASASSSTAYRNSAVATSSNDFTYSLQSRNTTQSTPSNGLGEDRENLGIGTFQTPASPFRDPNYPTGSMTDGMASMSLNSASAPSNQTYHYAGETEDQVSPDIFGKLIRRTPNSGEYEELDSRYREVETKNLKKFWKVGRVFMMLWTEPARTRVPPAGGTRDGSHFSTIYLNEQVYSEIRRFVVVCLNYGSTVCSPIHTYSKQGTFKPNLPEVQQHAIIHTSKNPPKELYYTAADGTVVYENLLKDPIRVVSEQKEKEGDLGDYSRINYSKIYTVENYVRVLNIGMVHPNSMDSLILNAFVKQREESPQPPRQHRKRDKDDKKQSRDRDDKKTSNKKKGERSKDSDRRKF